jgi:hypothetical protein
MDKKRKQLEQWQIEDAVRLKSIFVARAGMSQADFAVESGIGTTQRSVEQYVNGRIPLNLLVLSKFSSTLCVRPEQISPRLAEYLNYRPSEIGERKPPGHSMPKDRRDEILRLFDKLVQTQKDEKINELRALARKNESIARELTHSVPVAEISARPTPPTSEIQKRNRRQSIRAGQ